MLKLGRDVFLGSGAAALAAWCGLGLPLPAQCDPVQEAKLLASDGGSYDLFGSAVGLDGDFAVVGARQDGSGFEGSAYVFERRGGVWGEAAKLRAFDAAADDRFGYAAALSGDSIAIGAPNDDDRGAFSGSVYVYERRGGFWLLAHKLLAADGSADDAFGAAVALSGAVLVAGADCADPRGFSSGAAYVFERSGGAWIQTAKLVPADGAALDSFGFSVAVDGDCLVVGAYGADQAAPDGGAAYVFERSGADWVETGKLLAPDAGDHDYFGQSVAMRAGRIVVGAPLHDGPHLIAGAAYVFEKLGAAWRPSARLQPFDPERGERFGLFVAAGDALLAASSTSSAPGGALFLFEEVAGRWTQTSRIAAADMLGFEEFGHGLAVAGDSVITGALSDDDLGPLSGSAYVFRASTAAACPRLTLAGACGGLMSCRAQGLTPGGAAAFFASSQRRAFTLTGAACHGITLDLHPPFQGSSPFVLVDADGDGGVGASAYAPPGLCGRLRVQALDLSACRKTNYVDL